jgi:hypothetical protein
MSPEPLNLTDWEEVSYEAVPTGKYWFEIMDAEERETQGGDGAKLPKGTPMIWVHLRLTGRVGEDSGPDENSPYYNKRVFSNMPVPPADYDPKKRRMMNGRLVNFYKGVGYTEEEITSGEFEPDADELYERQGIVQVRKEKDKRDSSGQTFTNSVQAFFPLDSVDSNVSSGLI